MGAFNVHASIFYHLCHVMEKILHNPFDTDIFYVCDNLIANYYDIGISSPQPRFIAIAITMLQL